MGYFGIHMADLRGVQKMSVSKAWEWNKENNSIWLEPSEESYYIAHRWKEKNYRDI